MKARVGKRKGRKCSIVYEDEWKKNVTEGKAI